MLSNRMASFIVLFVLLSANLFCLIESTGFEVDPDEQNKIGILNTIYTDRVTPQTTRGLLIDAGSGGSRMHVYEWAPRVFNKVPPPISFPTTNEKYTGRISNGIQECWKRDISQEELRGNLKAHLAPLIDFAKNSLEGMEDDFKTIPIWFKATGGARELTPAARMQLVDTIRSLLSDEDFCPFYFQSTMARVISGEEEAVFSWACMNFLLGNLIPESKGIGTVYNISRSYGTVDLGGSSTQISFFLPSEDYMEGLYKLQIGGQKHWNVYTHSSLQFGINSARKRHFQTLAQAAIEAIRAKNTSYIDENVLHSVANQKDTRGTFVEEDDDREVSGKLLYTMSIVNPCFASGYSEEATRIPISAGHPEFGVVNVNMSGPDTRADNYNDKGDQFKQCVKALVPLMEKSSGGYCNLVYHGECGIGGEYQPTLPTGEAGNFMGTSSYKIPWAIMGLPSNSSIQLLSERASEICDMDWKSLNEYVHDNKLTEKGVKEKQIQYSCFMSAYAFVLLHVGYGFKANHTVTVVDVVNGNKAGWALGAILHELNNLPWELDDPFDRQPWGKYILCVTIGLIIGAALAFSVSKELNLDDYKRRTSNQQVMYMNMYGTYPNSNEGNRATPPTSNASLEAGNVVRARSSTGIQMSYISTEGGPDNKSPGTPLSDNGSNSTSPGAGWQDQIKQFVTPFVGGGGGAGGGYQAIPETSSHNKTDGKDNVP